MKKPAGLAKRAATTVLGRPRVGAAVRGMAALGGRSMTLVYHRVGAPQPSGLTPTVALEDFRLHLQTLQALGEIVPLSRLLLERRSPTPRFALTFDDDHPCHVEVVLPTLREQGLPATFFLSGRSLHGLGSYWFQSLEHLLHGRGVAAVADLLDLAPTDAGEIAGICEADLGLQAKLEAADDRNEPSLSETQIAALVAAGMEIGFHTLHHRPLTALGGDDLDRALSEGRGTLAEAAGRPIRLFAYPHGKADARVAERVRYHGYEGAWTGVPSPVTRRADRYRLGRWEPGPIEPSDLTTKITGRMARLRMPR